MNIKFSVIIVCLNSEKTIEKTLKSLLAQTYQDFEVIVIDGASTDNTLNIIKSYESRFKDIMIVSEPDSGIYQAMNKGIGRAKGELVSFLNSDDYYVENALEVINQLYEEEYDGIYGRISFIKEVNHRIYEHEIMNGEPEDIFKGTMPPHPATFIKREVIKNHKFDESYKIAADYKMLLILIQQNYRFKSISHKITYMRDDGISNTQLELSYRERIRCEKEVLGKVHTNLHKEVLKIRFAKKIKILLGDIGAPILYSSFAMKCRGWKRL